MELSKYKVRTSVSCVVIPREEAINMITDMIVGLVSDLDYVKECISEGIPLPTDSVSGKDLSKCSLSELRRIMEEVGVLDQFADADMLVLSENIDIEIPAISKTAIIL